MERLPPTSAYATKEYWDSRFQEETEYDWLCTYHDFKTLLDALVETLLESRQQNGDEDARRNLKILLVGCGTSMLPRDMVEDGYQRIWATDYSEVVVERCIKEQGGYEGKVVWEVRDMKDLSAYNDESFDIVLDKAAMDAVLAIGGDKWDVDPELLKATDTILREAHRVLVKDGFYCQISFSQPHFRGQYLKSEGAGKWRAFEKQTIDRGLGYLFYSMWADK